MVISSLALFAELVDRIERAELYLRVVLESTLVIAAVNVVLP